MISMLPFAMFDAEVLHVFLENRAECDQLCQQKAEINIINGAFKEGF